MRIRIHAVPLEGGPQSTITIEQTGPDMATIDIDGVNYQVYDVRVGADGKTLVCKGGRPFPLTVTVQLIASDASGATVSISVVGGLINQTRRYRITPADEADLTQFITGSKFPVLA